MTHRLSRFVVLALFGLAASTSSLRAATITVTGSGDSINADGLTTLREAIVSINAGADANSDVAATRSGSYGDPDQIHFLIGSGAQTVSPSVALPSIQTTMTIDGTTQPGFAGEPLIAIDGAAAGSQSNGLVISSVTDSRLEAVRVQNFGGVGILITAPPSDLIFANGFQ